MARPRDLEPPPGCDDAPADPEQVARTIILRRLDSAPRTRAQLKDTLAQRGVPQAVADRVLDRFEEVGLIDDRLYARMWVQSRQSGRGLSARALGMELRRRGVAEEHISESLHQLTPEMEEDAALRLAANRARSMSGVDDVVAARRLTGYLGRRGYGPGLVARVVRQVLAERGEEIGGGTDVEEHLPFA